MKSFFQKWWLLFALMAFQTAVSLLVNWDGSFTREAHHSSITFTMRYCTVIFCIAYMSRGLHVIFNSQVTRFLMVNRKMIGMAFAYSFVFHLVELMFLHDTITMSPFMFGLQLIPLAFINLMGITSIPIVQRNMSQRLWKIIHQWGSVTIWLALFKNYILIYFVPALQEGRTFFYLGTFLVAITPLVRLYLIYRKSRRKVIAIPQNHTVPLKDPAGFHPNVKLSKH